MPSGGAKGTAGRLAKGENEGCRRRTTPTLEGWHRTALLGVVYTTCTNAMGETVDSMIWFHPATDSRVRTCIDPGENAAPPPKADIHPKEPLSLNAKVCQCCFDEPRGRSRPREKNNLIERCCRSRSRHRKVSGAVSNAWLPKASSSRALTIPVSALRCCDWKKTASWWLHAGQLRVALGS